MLMILPSALSSSSSSAVLLLPVLLRLPGHFGSDPRLCSSTGLSTAASSCRRPLPHSHAQHAALPSTRLGPGIHGRAWTNGRMPRAARADGRPKSMSADGSCTRAAAGRISGRRQPAHGSHSTITTVKTGLALPGGPGATGWRQASESSAEWPRDAPRPAACRPARDCIPLIAQAHVLLGLKRRCAGARGAGGVRGASRAPRGALLRRKRTISVQAHFGLAYCRCRSVRLPSNISTALGHAPASFKWPF